jgi:O-6-methylguanine DNA methyltransferase
MTYQEVAAKAGSPGASRAVGSLMKANHDPSIPCHRVVRSDGSIGEYNRAGGSKTKWSRLEEEGVDMSKLHL